MTYERISIPPEDAQFIATRKFQKTEIATIYGVPPHMIADLERSTNNNIEHQAMEFVRYCLMPYLVRLEEEFNRKLLRHDEFEEYYYLFALNGLLRGDAKTRSEFYKNMNFVGAMSANEIRNLEDMNSYDGGNEYFVQMNMQPVKHAINGKKNQ
jgi:HK97 family phage portal protein